MTVQTTSKMMHRTKNSLPEEVREKIIDLLQSRLADSIDMLMQSKQAHWNVRGPRFIGLHELFDDVHTTVEAHVDTIAERLAALGGISRGTIRMAGKATTLPEYPAEIVDGLDHVDALSTSLAAYGKNIRESIAKAGDLGDADTEDLFTEISRETDIKLWFVEAHIQGKD